MHAHLEPILSPPLAVGPAQRAVDLILLDADPHPGGDGGVPDEVGDLAWSKKVGQGTVPPAVSSPAFPQLTPPVEAPLRVVAKGVVSNEQDARAGPREGEGR